MVNYHAVGLFVTSRGGFTMHNPQEDANLKVGKDRKEGRKEGNRIGRKEG
jgi:hypothetical protein